MNVELDSIRGSLAALRRNARHAEVVLRHILSASSLPNSRFIIFGRGRSGSTALVSLLNSLPGVHCDGEILHHPLLFPRAHVHARCAAAGVAQAYGCKILSYQVLRVQPIRSRTDFIRKLRDDGFRIIYLHRENLIEHAVSNIRALRHGFHVRKGQVVVKDAIHIDLTELRHWIAGSEQLAQFEAKVLEGVPHLALTYERNLGTEMAQQHAVRQVCDYVEIDPRGTAQCAYRKVSPLSLRESIANYDEIADALAGTVYARFL